MARIRASATFGPTFLACLSAGALLAGISGTAFAQQVAEGPPKVQNIRAVERGGFVETDIGLSYLVNTIQGRQYGLGTVAGVFLGYDITDIFSFSLGVTSMGASVNGNAPPPTGDLLFVIPMAQLQLALVTTERNFFYVRAGGGFSFGLPADISGTPYGGNGPAFEGLIGYEHFTQLRHFSIGIQAGALAVLKPAFGLGVSVVPLLKYTF
jgi:hypothetical protein